MRIVLCALSVSLLAFAQAPQQSLSGSWVDSQGNRFELVETENVVRVTSKGWDFDVGPKSFNADLTLAGVRSGDEFTAGQRTNLGFVVLKGRLAANGSLRGTLTAPGETPFDFVLVRMQKGAPQTATAPPQRISMSMARSSATLGRWIPVSIGLAAADGRIVAPAQATFIDLTSSGGTPIPGRVRVTAAHPRAPAGIRVDNPEVTLKASAAGLEAVTLTAWGCADSPVTAIRISTRRSEAIADGRDALPLIVKFVDAAGAPSNNQARPKSLDWNVTGAVRRPLAGRGGGATDTVGSEECVSLQEITSERPGKASITARFANVREEITLQFVAPLTALVIGMALLGGLFGGIASAAQNYRSAMRWKPGRWLASLFTAEAGALALFLGWHYGLVSNMANLPSGAGVAFLAGMIGGWAGTRVLAALSDTVIPSDKARAAGAA
jgi:hypothetical protein